MTRTGLLLVAALLAGCGQLTSDAPVAPDPPDAEPTSATPGPDAARTASRDPSWGRGCVETNPGACVHWAMKARELGEDYTPFLEPACEWGHGYACLLLGDFRRKDDGAPWDDVLPLYERGCTFGTGDACGRVASQKTGEEQQALLEKGCALRCARCCIDAGLPVPEK